MKRGFTLIEMLVVVGIVAVLMTTLIHQYRQARHKASVVAQFTEIRQELDKALIRGALTPKTYEEARQNIDRMFKIAINRKP